MNTFVRTGIIYLYMKKRQANRRTYREVTKTPHCFIVNYFLIYEEKILKYFAFDWTERCVCIQIHNSPDIIKLFRTQKRLHKNLATKFLQWKNYWESVAPVQVDTEANIMFSLALRSTTGTMLHVDNSQLRPRISRGPPTSFSISR